MNIAQRREKVLRYLRRRNRYQFGQPPDTCNLVQESGCTDACIQMIVWMAKDKSVSLNDVRRRSGAPHNSPMNTTEAIRALRSYGLPYEIRTDLGASQVVNIARSRGPVIICELYYAHPQWKGYTYAGRTLKGTTTNYRGTNIRVAFSKPLQRSGLTQWTFRDGHAILVATDDRVDGVHVVVERDPNHNSASRPERPAYDLVTVPQLRRQIDSFNAKYGVTVALIPTRPVIK